jgi:hypothetical protein
MKNRLKVLSQYTSIMSTVCVTFLDLIWCEDQRFAFLYTTHSYDQYWDKDICMDMPTEHSSGYFIFSVTDIHSHIYIYI